MSDSYQAIYDAVRSRISGGNIADAVRDVAFQAFDISHTKAILQQEFIAAAFEMQRPCVGPDPQTGVFATGATPAEAMTNFDQEFWKGRPVSLTPHPDTAVSP